MRILVAMSGGVDSSVCAYVLKQAGHDCIGTTMRLITNESMGIVGESTCCSTADVLDAARVCDMLGMRHVSFDLEDEFTDAVIKPFSESYAAGLTPNPCIECNRTLKFGLLWRFAQQLGCDALATGHYARVVHNTQTGLYELHRAFDELKDQSYVVHPVPQDVLAHLVLPLGEFKDKAEVRALAKEAGLPTASKHDSQDICFVPDGNYPAFLERFRGKPLQKGEIVNGNGEVLGHHAGIERFTIGQRKGLDVATGQRIYVCAKDPATQRLVVGSNDELMATALELNQLNWLDGVAPSTDIEGQALVCHHGIFHPVRVSPRGTAQAYVSCIEPIRAPAPGQSMVVYDKDKVVCGGIIARVSREPQT